VGMKVERKHAFSIEMRAREHLKKITVSSSAHEGILIEGYLGELEELGLVEDVILEVKGANGTLRIDLSRQELLEMLAKEKRKTDDS
jgi:hypothetical protein